MSPLRDLLKGRRDDRHLLLGNEAIARGVLESGISVVTGYPGTPSSEILDLLVSVSDEAGIYAEHSVNEIVALEIAAGASFSGLPAMAVMKHVGLNVAADALFTLAYTGSPGGLIIVSADDPNAYSSQNEQDNRFYAMHAGIPMFEPSDPQEAKDMVLEALELSRKREVPVLFRTTTAVNHSRGIVKLAGLPSPKMTGEFKREFDRFVSVPSTARKRRKILIETLDALQEDSEGSKWNQITGRGHDASVISSGVTSSYVLESVEELGLNIDVFRLGFTHTLPEQRLVEFLESHERVGVIEELEPYLETQIRALAQEHDIDTDILGKELGLPVSGDLDPVKVRTALSRCVDIPAVAAAPVDVSGLPQRTPLMCAGCPHRASFYILRRVLPTREHLYATDIGCYSLGAFPPTSVGDTLLCMGGSLGVGTGLQVAGDKGVVSVIGDSTFYHAGIPGLINGIHNQHDLIVAVLDNQITAMTGQQPNPSSQGKSRTTTLVPIEKICEGLGVEDIRVVDPLRIAEAERQLSDIGEGHGVRVIVFRSPCTLVHLRDMRETEKEVPYYGVVSEECTDCRVCLTQIDCPAIVSSGGEKPRILTDQCTGCSICAHICPFDAIQPAGMRAP